VDVEAMRFASGTEFYFDTFDFNINGVDADNFTTSVLWPSSSYVRFHTPM